MYNARGGPLFGLLLAGEDCAVLLPELELYIEQKAFSGL